MSRKNELTTNTRGDENRNNVSPFINDYFNLFDKGTGSFSYDDKKGIINLSGQQNGYHVTVTAEEGLGKTLTQTSYPIFDNKSEYREEVLRLYNDVGLKQREIAARLNISQSTVSNLLK